MPAVLDRLKSAAYTSVGINLLIADAIVGREVATPKFATDGDVTARQQAGEALTGFRNRTAPATKKLIGKLPDGIGGSIAKGQRAVWNRLGIDDQATETGDDPTETGDDPTETEGQGNSADSKAAPETDPADTSEETDTSSDSASTDTETETDTDDPAETDTDDPAETDTDAGSTSTDTETASASTDTDDPAESESKAP